jgi:hypothetical protein
MNVKPTDEQWQKILQILKSFPEIRLGAGRDCRRFLEAVLWITRSDSQWRAAAARLWQMEFGPTALPSKFFG